jgi:excisionase family DNA binding protein
MPRRNEDRIAEVHAARQLPKIGMSIEEAAWSLGVDRSTIDRLLCDGELPYTRVRSKPVIDPDDLTTMMKRHKVRRNSDPGFGRRGQDGEGAVNEAITVPAVGKNIPPAERRAPPVALRKNEVVKNRSKTPVSLLSDAVDNTT